MPFEDFDESYSDIYQTLALPGKSTIKIDTQEDFNKYFGTGKEVDVPVFIGLYKNDGFGDGSDGNVTISSNTVLTRDMYYDNLTVNLGKVLDTQGYILYVKGILINYGKITDTYSGGVPAVGGGQGGIGADTASSSAHNGGPGSIGTNGGAPLRPGAGYAGGRGGGGGGSASAYDNVSPKSGSGDSEWEEGYGSDPIRIYGTDGGVGGIGGKGGGVVKICAYKFRNYGEIDASGFDGEDGGDGDDANWGHHRYGAGPYRGSWTWYYRSFWGGSTAVRGIRYGGGGGGGAGGGGAGGKITIQYGEEFIDQGSYNVDGGVGGIGGSKGSYATSIEAGWGTSAPSCDTADGGDGGPGGNGDPTGKGKGGVGGSGANSRKKSTSPGGSNGVNGNEGASGLENMPDEAASGTTEAGWLWTYDPVYAFIEVTIPEGVTLLLLPCKEGGVVGHDGRMAYVLNTGVKVSSSVSIIGVGNPVVKRNLHSSFIGRIRFKAAFGEDTNLKKQVSDISDNQFTLFDVNNLKKGDTILHTGVQYYNDPENDPRDFRGENISRQGKYYKIIQISGYIVTVDRPIVDLGFNGYLCKTISEVRMEGWTFEGSNGAIADPDGYLPESEIRNVSIYGAAFYTTAAYSWKFPRIIDFKMKNKFGTAIYGGAFLDIDGVSHCISSVHDDPHTPNYVYDRGGIIAGVGHSSIKNISCCISRYKFLLGWVGWNWYSAGILYDCSFNIIENISGCVAEYLSIIYRSQFNIIRGIDNNTMLVSGAMTFGDSSFNTIEDVISNDFSNNCYLFINNYNLIRNVFNNKNALYEFRASNYNVVLGVHVGNTWIDVESECANNVFKNITT